MTSARRRLLRPAPSQPAVDLRRQRDLARRRQQRDKAQVALARWLSRLRRASTEVAKHQRTLSRLERLLQRLDEG